MAVDTGRLEAILTARQQLPSPSARRALRLEAGLSLAELARTIGCTRQAVANWEKGTAEPRGANLRAYVEVLNFLRRRLGASP